MPQDSEVILADAQSAYESLKKDSPFFANVSTMTMILLVVPIVVLVVMNVILINSNEALTSSGLVTLMVIDFVFVVIFLIGFYFLTDDIARYIILHKKSSLTAF